MTRTIEIKGTGKKALATILINKNDPDGEVTVIGMTTFYDNGRMFYYSYSQCKRHDFKLFNLVKKYLYE